MGRRLKIGIIAAAALVIIFLLLTVFILRVRTVTVAGNSHYTASEVEDMFFGDGMSRAPLIIKCTELFGRRDIPQVESYELSFDGLTSVSIKIKERVPYGYVPHMGSNLFFDKDGVVLKSSGEVFEDVCRVSGLKVDKAVIGERLQVADDSNFKGVATVIDVLTQRQVTLGGLTMYAYAAVDEIAIYNTDEFSLIMGDVKVMLGKNINLHEKLLEMIQMLPSLEGKSGVLHMEDYSSSTGSYTCYFDDK